MKSDDELIDAMWRAFQAAEHVGHPDGPMNAVLQAVRAHDGDAERWRALLKMLSGGDVIEVSLHAYDEDGATDVWYQADVTTLTHAIDAAIAAEGE